MNLTRRSFLGFGTALASGASVAFASLFTRTAAGAVFGPLVPDPDGVLDLPAGFRYQLLQTAGDVMSDGAVLRGQPDGMAAFPGATANQVILMRNHELTVDGGVSRLVIDVSDLNALVVTASNDVLGETSRNCAGGPSPWGWLSCEERPAIGGVWLCPLATESKLAGGERVRIDAYGSFSHEAVAIDPASFIAYLTEDDGNSFFYRMVPSQAKKDPFTGQLQAMKRVGVDAFNTALMTPGQSIDIEWVDVSAATPRADATAAAATIVVRGEGIWWFDGVVYFSATSNGQIFELVPDAKNEGGTLRLLTNTMQAPDNITVAPWGDIFVAEDNLVDNHLRIVDTAGTVSDFARNRIAPATELAGVCFSPDGRILFVNLYGLGRTLAITGPFPGVDSPPQGSAGSPGSGGEVSAGGSDAAGAEAGGTADGTAGEGSSETAAGEGGAGLRASGAGAAATPEAGAPGAAPEPVLSLAGGGCDCEVAGARQNPGALVGLASAAALGLRRRAREP